jgi:hypothetical protein
MQKISKGVATPTIIIDWLVWFMVLNATFSNILLVEETGVPRENHRPIASHLQTIT